MKKGTKILVIWVVVLAFIIPLATLVFSSIDMQDNTQEQQLVTELAENFSITNSKYAKKLENAYQQYPNNEEICAIYCYYNALYYQQKNNQYDETIDYTIYSQLYLRQINSSYSGVMSAQIYSFGISLFGSKTKWDNETVYFKAKYNTLSQTDKKTIIKWIKNRYSYYGNKEDYSQEVFNDAATYFGLLYEEIDMLWSEYSLNPYPLY